MPIGARANLSLRGCRQAATAILVGTRSRERIAVQLSLFSGCGGLDLGFEQAGHVTGLAYDRRVSSIASWNRNRPQNPVGREFDLNDLTLERLDEHYGSTFRPTSVVGGPPCQSFTNANSRKRSDDPRTGLVARFFDIALALHARSPLEFVVMENVRELSSARYRDILNEQIERLERVGLRTEVLVLDARNFGVAQNRKRLFLVALSEASFGGAKWQPPTPDDEFLTVGDVIGSLPEPTYFAKGLSPDNIACHPNHWCMVPKSPKFRSSALKPGQSFGRSFKMLDWSKPSFTVSYGNREVHVHPSGKRRLSVYEAMLLQGFPADFVLSGTLSSQITQVSEAVPPPLANAIAQSIKAMRLG